MDVTRYLGAGGFSYSRSRIGQPIIKTGEITFQTPEYDPNPISLDKRVNPLWCRGAIVRIYALSTAGVERQLVELVLQKVAVRLADVRRVPREITCSLTDYLGERSSRGKDVESIASSGTTRTELAIAALREGATRNLVIQLSGFGDDQINGTFPLLANDSNASLAAQFGASTLQWLYVDNQGIVRNAGVSLSNERRVAPVARYAMEDCARHDYLAPSEDLASKVSVSSTEQFNVADGLPYTAIDEEYARFSDIFPGAQVVGNSVILAVRTVTRVNSRNEVRREVTKPLASWVTFSDVSDIDPQYIPLLRQYYTVVYSDGLRQHDFQGRLIGKSTISSGIIGAFRQNFSTTVADAFENRQTILDRVDLRNRVFIQHFNGIPVARQGFEETPSDNWLNGPITSANASSRLAAIRWGELWVRWARGLYRRKYNSTAPNLRQETQFGPPTGPPSPEYLPVGNERDTRLIEGEYETDISNVNCGEGKEIPLEIPYGDRESLDRVAQYELERRIAADRAVRIAIPLGDWFFNYVPLSRVDAGKFAYRTEAASVAWDNDKTLVLATECHEIGELANEIPYRPEGPPTWPPEITAVPGVIEGASTCEPVAVAIPYDGNLRIRNIPDIAINEGETFEWRLSATGGTSSYTFADLGGSLPAGLAIAGDVLSGSVVTPGVYTITIQVADGVDVASTSFDLRVQEVETPTFPVPAPIRIRGALVFTGDMRVLPYSRVQEPIPIQGALVLTGRSQTFERQPDIPMQGALVFTGQVSANTGASPNQVQFNNGDPFTFNDGTPFEFNS